MAKRREQRTTGSGMTRRVETRITATDSEGLREAIEELYAAQGGNYFAEAQEWAVETLRAAGLPTDYLVRYSAEDVTAWAPHDGERRAECGYTTCGHYVVNKRGYEPDTPEGYAARILDRLHRMEANPDAAAWFGYEIGYLVREATMKFRWEPRVLKTLDSEKNLNEAREARRRQISNEHERRRSTLVPWLREYFNQNPRATWTDAHSAARNTMTNLAVRSAASGYRTADSLRHAMPTKKELTDDTAE